MSTSEKAVAGRRQRVGEGRRALRGAGGGARGASDLRFAPRSSKAPAPDTRPPISGRRGAAPPGGRPPPPLLRRDVRAATRPPLPRDYEPRHAPLRPRGACRELQSGCRGERAPPAARGLQGPTGRARRRPAPRPSSLPPPRPAGLAARARARPRRPAPLARPRRPMSMAKRLAFSRLRKISSGGSVMLLSRLSPLLPLPLAPHSAILNVLGQPHQPWRYMRIYLTAKRLPRIDYANERSAGPRPSRRCDGGGWRADSGRRARVPQTGPRGS